MAGAILLAVNVRNFKCYQEEKQTVDTCAIPVIIPKHDSSLEILSHRVEHFPKPHYHLQACKGCHVFTSLKKIQAGVRVFVYADIIIWNERHFITHAATSFRLHKLCYWI